MVCYSPEEYKIEMAGIRDKMPRNWMTIIVDAHFKSSSKEEVSKIKYELVNVISGNSYQKGVKDNYVNLIREVYSQETGLPLTKLPETIYHKISRK